MGTLRPRFRERSLSDSSDATVVPSRLYKLKSKTEQVPSLQNQTVSNPGNISADALSHVDKFRGESGHRAADSVINSADKGSRLNSQVPPRFPSTQHPTVENNANHDTGSPPHAIDDAESLSPYVLQVLLVSLQLLSLVPASTGAAYCVFRAVFPLPQSLYWYRATSRNGSYVTDVAISRRFEWLLSAMWAILSGNYCHSMARGLTRRWLVYYPLPAAIIRLVSLQVICWPLTHFTVNKFFGNEDLQLPAWMVCALTSAISNTVQIWVTSNLRFLHVSGASSHTAEWANALRLRATVNAAQHPPEDNLLSPISPSYAFDRRLVPPRGLQSSQVIRQTVLPIAACSFLTMLWALTQVYNSREVRLAILT